jgi:hypothetical protein
MTGTVKGLLVMIGVAFILGNVFLSIGDRFMTSDSLVINQTENAEGYAAQRDLNESFIDNIGFVDVAVFTAVAAAIIWIISRVM